MATHDLGTLGQVQPFVLLRGARPWHNWHTHLRRPYVVYLRGFANAPHIGGTELIPLVPLSDDNETDCGTWYTYKQFGDISYRIALKLYDPQTALADHYPELRVEVLTPTQSWISIWSNQGLTGDISEVQDSLQEILALGADSQIMSDCNYGWNEISLYHDGPDYYGTTYYVHYSPLPGHPGYGPPLTLNMVNIRVTSHDGTAAVGYGMKQRALKVIFAGSLNLNWIPEVNDGPSVGQWFGGVPGGFDVWDNPLFEHGANSSLHHAPDQTEWAWIMDAVKNATFYVDPVYKQDTHPMRSHRRLWKGVYILSAGGADRIVRIHVEAHETGEWLLMASMDGLTEYAEVTHTLFFTMGMKEGDIEDGIALGYNNLAPSHRFFIWPNGDYNLVAACLRPHAAHDGTNENTAEFYNAFWRAPTGPFQVSVKAVSATERPMPVLRLLDGESEPTADDAGELPAEEHTRISRFRFYPRILSHRTETLRCNLYDTDGAGEPTATMSYFEMDRTVALTPSEARFTTNTPLKSVSTSSLVFVLGGNPTLTCTIEIRRARQTYNTQMLPHTDCLMFRGREVSDQDIAVEIMPPLFDVTLPRNELVGGTTYDLTVTIGVAEESDLTVELEQSGDVPGGPYVGFGPSNETPYTTVIPAGEVSLVVPMALAAVGAATPVEIRANLPQAITEYQGRQFVEPRTVVLTILP